MVCVACAMFMHVCLVCAGIYIHSCNLCNFALGTWRTHIVGNVRKFVRISRDIPVDLAATLVVNPCTAYRMLKVFVDLKPGQL